MIVPEQPLAQRQGEGRDRRGPGPRRHQVAGQHPLGPQRGHQAARFLFAGLRCVGRFDVFMFPWGPSPRLTAPYFYTCPTKSKESGKNMWKNR